MALARWQATIVNEQGDVQPGASIEVRRELPLSGLPSLYDDRAGAIPLGNPFIADSEGFAAFHVAGGAYKITARLGAFSRTWRYAAIGAAAENDLADGDTITWDFSTPGQAKPVVVPFIQDHPQALPRPYLSKNRDAWNVFDFGTSDHDDAFDRAFDAFAGDGICLDVPHGTFQLSQKLQKTFTVNRHSKLRGAGRDVTRIVWTLNNGGIDLTLNNGVHFNGNTLDVEGLSLLTTATTQGTAFRINGQFVSGHSQPGATFRDLIIAGTDENKGWGTGIRNLNNQQLTCDNITLIGQRLQYIFTPIHIDGASDPTDHLLSKIRTTWSGTAIFVDGNVEGLNIVQPTLIATKNGVLFNAPVGEPHFSVSDGHINASEACIAGVNALQSTIHDLVCYEWNHGNSTGTWRGVFFTGPNGDHNNVHHVTCLSWDAAGAATKIGIDFDQGSRGKAYGNIFRGFPGVPMTTGVRIGAGANLTEYGDNTFDNVTTPVQDLGTNTIGRINTPGATTLQPSTRGMVAGVFVPTSSVAPSNGMYLPAANTLGVFSRCCRAHGDR